MRLSHFALSALIAFTAFIGVPSATRADSGSISFRVIKAGFVVGGSGGSGVLYFHGRRYPISIGGVSYGFTFGASATDFHGRSATFGGRPTSPASMRRAVSGPRLVSALAQLCSPTKTARC